MNEHCDPRPTPAALDAADPLARSATNSTSRAHGDGEQLYFCGNSLGLQPKAVRGALLDELDDWARLGVEAHFHGKHPWMPYHEFVRESLAALRRRAGREVVAMNSLSVNLHLMMVSFYRPTAQRHAILIEAGAFPVRPLRGRVAGPLPWLRSGALADRTGTPTKPDGTISMAAIERVLAERGQEIALVLWPGVQYRSGQAFDLREITRLAHAAGLHRRLRPGARAPATCALQLHDSGADFAAWCSYKYLNSGPGAVAGCFVHERHARSDRPRFAGWWGHDQATRFRMGPEFVPTPGADGWQLSNPPILALAPLRVSLEIFQRAGMACAAREVGAAHRLPGAADPRTPGRHAARSSRRPTRRAAAASCRLRVVGGRERGRALFEHLAAQGIIGDWREPDVIRISPTPLYNRLFRRAPLRAGGRRLAAAPDRSAGRNDHHRRRRPGRRAARHAAGPPGWTVRGIREAPRPAPARLRGRPLDQPRAGRTRPARAAPGRPAGRGDGAGGDDARPHGACRSTAPRSCCATARTTPR